MTIISNQALEVVESALDLPRLFEQPPAVTESDVSSEEDDSSIASVISDNALPFDYEESGSAKAEGTPTRRPNLRWEFRGLTIWLELEEFDSDLTRVIRDLSASHGVLPIPRSHATAIYGMTHLTTDEAKSRLRSFAASGSWPPFRRPVGVVQDVAVAGNPGQVCSIAWAQLTLASGPEHEAALDELYGSFYGPDSAETAGRDRPWTPHNSVVYDNPEGTVLSLHGTLERMMRYPTLLSRERRVQAISLWSTEGKMEEWECLDRVKFF